MLHQAIFNNSVYIKILSSIAYISWLSNISALPWTLFASKTLTFAPFPFVNDSRSCERKRNCTIRYRTKWLNMKQNLVCCRKVRRQHTTPQATDTMPFQTKR
jgi:hypothetical protein